VKRAALAFLVFALISRSAAAQEKRFNLTLEPAFVNMYGNDTRVGDTFTFSLSGGLADALYIFYGVSYKPIVLSPSGEMALRWGASYSFGKWSLGANGWGYRSLTEESGRVESSPVGDSVSGVRMWDYTLMPVDNQYEPSGFSSVLWNASNEFSMWSASLYAERSIVGNYRSSFSLGVGVRFAEMANLRIEGQEQTALIYGDGGNLVNNISLQGWGAVDLGVFYGPMIRFSGRTSFGRLRLSGDISQSFIFGSVPYSGNWRDVDDIGMGSGEIGEPVQNEGRLAYIEGNFPVESRERGSMKVAEINLRASTDLLSVLGVRFSVGVGGFFSLFGEAPVAPRWSAGTWSFEGGSGWRFEKRDLTFSGVSVNLGASF